jgi:hypothetical protein
VSPSPLPHSSRDLSHSQADRAVVQRTSPNSLSTQPPRSPPTPRCTQSTSSSHDGHVQASGQVRLDGFSRPSTPSHLPHLSKNLNCNSLVAVRRP